MGLLAGSAAPRCETPGPTAGPTLGLQDPWRGPAGCRGWAGVRPGRAPADRGAGPRPRRPAAQARHAAGPRQEPVGPAVGPGVTCRGAADPAKSPTKIGPAERHIGVFSPTARLPRPTATPALSVHLIPPSAAHPRECRGPDSGHGSLSGGLQHASRPSLRYAIWVPAFAGMSGGYWFHWRRDLPERVRVVRVVRGRLLLAVYTGPLEPLGGARWGGSG